MESRKTQPLFFKINLLLGGRDRKRLLGILGLHACGSLLELMSLGLVIPVIRFVFEGDRRDTVNWLPRFAKDLEYHRFVLVLMALLVTAFLMKNLFILVSGQIQLRVQDALNNRLVEDMFKRYMRQPYEFHLSHSPTQLLRNIQLYCGAVVGQTIQPALTLAAELLTGIGFVVVFITLEPIATLVMLVVGALTLILILKLTRSRTRRLGEEGITQRGIMMETVMSGLYSVKEFLVSGKDADLYRALRVSLRESSRLGRLFNLYQKIPRASLEVFLVAILSLVVLSDGGRRDGANSSTLLLALFGVAAFRVVPAINRVVFSIQQLSHASAAIDGAVEAFRLPMTVPRELPPEASQVSIKTIRFKSVRYQYPGSDRVVLDVPDLLICSGETIGVVGTSGSGKSTFVDLLTGILAPTHGNIYLDSWDLRNVARSWMDSLGYVSQTTYLINTSIRRNVAFGLAEEEISDLQVESALRSSQLWDFVNELPAKTETVIGDRGVRLSGGQRQRLGIARALYNNPAVLILDEATSALDLLTEAEVVKSIEEISKNRTVLQVAHRTTSLAHCSRVLRIEAGRIVADGSYQIVIANR